MQIMTTSDEPKGSGWYRAVHVRAATVPFSFLFLSLAVPRLFKDIVDEVKASKLWSMISTFNSPFFYCKMTEYHNAECLFDVRSQLTVEVTTVNSWSSKM